MAAPAEFALIARHFLPLAGPGALGLADDGALRVLIDGREHHVHAGEVSVRAR